MFSAPPNPPDSRRHDHLIGAPPTSDNVVLKLSEASGSWQTTVKATSEARAALWRRLPHRWVDGESMASQPDAPSLGFIGVCLAMVIGLAGWLYWTHPSTATASLPDGAQRGEEEYLSGALPPPVTRHGMLSPGPLHSRNHEWVGTVTWKPFYAAEQDYELRLGESAHIEGLGTVTLLEVNPPSAIPEINFFKERNVGGWKYRVNIALDPGLSLCTKLNPCTQK